MKPMITVGEPLDPLTKTPSEVALLAFSAATWNMHRIHFDRDYARSEGHRDVVVHGSLQANWLVERALSLWPGAMLTSFTFRNVATAYVGEEFRVIGTPQEVEQDGEHVRVVVSLTVEGPSGPTTVGTVGLQLPGSTEGEAS